MPPKLDHINIDQLHCRYDFKAPFKKSSPVSRDFEAQISICSDSLSVVAGVVRILTAAAKISIVLIKFSRTIKDAPQQANVVVTGISDMSVVLSQLQASFSAKKLVTDHDHLC